jgi:hypothetical protein
MGVFNTLHHCHVVPHLRFLSGSCPVPVGYGVLLALGSECRGFTIWNTLMAAALEQVLTLVSQALPQSVKTEEHHLSLYLRS